MNKITYREADLEYIYIRAQLPNGRWGNLPLSETSDTQFLEWLQSRFGSLEELRDIIPDGVIWTPKKRTKLLNDLAEKTGFNPTMLKKALSQKEQS